MIRGTEQLQAPTSIPKAAGDKNLSVDIVPKTDGARLVVMIQIILDLIFIGLVARLLVGAVQRRIGDAPREVSSPTEQPVP
jgi:hypothetical protein